MNNESRMGKIEYWWDRLSNNTHDIDARRKLDDLQNVFAKRRFHEARKSGREWVLLDRQVNIRDHPCGLVVQ